MNKTALLSDPVSCGEDLAYNARRAMELAPLYCGDCEDYHYLSPARRLAAGPGKAGIEADRPRLFQLIADHVIAQGKVSGEAIDVVIAGSNDTGLLSTCAHAALSATSDASSRVRFTVLDRCQTPLLLCAEYAARHGIVLKADAVDLVETENRYPADILLHHSLLRFLPLDRRVAVLRKFAGWLKPGGRIIFSTSIKPSVLKDAEFSRRARKLELVREKIEAGVLTITEPLEAFNDRVDRLLRSAEGMTEFEDPDMVRELFSTAGMTIISFEEIFPAESPAKDPLGRRATIIALLEAGRSG
jgi:hypothetical protein